MGIMGHCIVQAALSTHSVFTMIASYSRTGLRDADGSELAKDCASSHPEKGFVDAPCMPITKLHLHLRTHALREATAV